MGARLRPSPALVVALIALFVSIGGVGYAASKIGTDDIQNKAVTKPKIDKQAVTSNRIADLAVKTKKIADSAVNGDKVLDNSLTGSEIDESTLAQVPSAANADTLGGKSAAGFVSSAIYRRESAIMAGTPFGTTNYIDEACLPGDILLNGGPANVANDSIMVESFPTPGSTNSWRARIKPPAGGDNFSVVVLCADQ